MSDRDRLLNIWQTLTFVLKELKDSKAYLSEEDFALVANKVRQSFWNRCGALLDEQQPMPDAKPADAFVGTTQRAFGASRIDSPTLKQENLRGLDLTTSSSSARSTRPSVTIEERLLSPSSLAEPDLNKVPATSASTLVITPTILELPERHNDLDHNESRRLTTGSKRLFEHDTNGRSFKKRRRTSSCSNAAVHGNCHSSDSDGVSVSSKKRLTEPAKRVVHDWLVKQDGEGRACPSISPVDDPTGQGPKRVQETNENATRKPNKASTEQCSWTVLDTNNISKITTEVEAELQTQQETDQMPKSYTLIERDGSIPILLKIFADIFGEPGEESLRTFLKDARHYVIPEDANQHACGKTRLPKPPNDIVSARALAVCLGSAMAEQRYPIHMPSSKALRCMSLAVASRQYEVLYADSLRGNSPTRKLFKCDGFHTKHIKSPRSDDFLNAYVVGQVYNLGAEEASDGSAGGRRAYVQEEIVRGHIYQALKDVFGIGIFAIICHSHLSLRFKDFHPRQVSATAKVILLHYPRTRRVCGAIENELVRPLLFNSNLKPDAVDNKVPHWSEGRKMKEMLAPTFAQ